MTDEERYEQAIIEIMHEFSKEDPDEAKLQRLLVIIQSNESSDIDDSEPNER